MREPGIDDAVKATLAAIRLAVEEQQTQVSAGAQVTALIRELREKYGAGAVEITALFLARSAANGFLGIARLGDHPVDDVLADFARHFETSIDFRLITAHLDDDPPAAP
jgi:hypothetical protein